MLKTSASDGAVWGQRIEENKEKKVVSEKMISEEMKKSLEESKDWMLRGVVAATRPAHKVKRVMSKKKMKMLVMSRKKKMVKYLAPRLKMKQSLKKSRKRVPSGGKGRNPLD